MCFDLFVKVIVFRQTGKVGTPPNHNLVWLYLCTGNQNPVCVCVCKVKKRLCVLFSVENQKTVLTQLSLSLPLRRALHKHVESRKSSQERFVGNR